MVFTDGTHKMRFVDSCCEVSPDVRRKFPTNGGGLRPPPPPPPNSGCPYGSGPLAPHTGCHPLVERWYTQIGVNNCVTPPPSPYGIIIYTLWYNHGANMVVATVQRFEVQLISDTTEKEESKTELLAKFCEYGRLCSERTH